MGALLSLPVVGYLLMPSLTSASTSLNLLFFYMVCAPSRPKSADCMLIMATDMEYTRPQPASAQSRGRRHARDSHPVLPRALVAISGFRLDHTEFGSGDEDTRRIGFTDKDWWSSEEDERRHASLVSGYWAKSFQHWPFDRHTSRS